MAKAKSKAKTLSESEKEVNKQAAIRKAKVKARKAAYEQAAQK